MEKKTTGFEYKSLAIFQKFVPRGIVKKNHMLQAQMPLNNH